MQYHSFKQLIKFDLFNLSLSKRHSQDTGDREILEIRLEEIEAVSNLSLR